MSKLIEHAKSECSDPDCELHNIDVAIAESVVSDTNVAYFFAGQKTAGGDLVRSLVEWALDQDHDARSMGDDTFLFFLTDKDVNDPNLAAECEAVLRRLEAIEKRLAAQATASR
jgi:hypothetical protein